MSAATIECKLFELEIVKCLAALPDTAALTSDEAAILLRTSSSTMQRMRRDGNGPAYIQARGGPGKGLNLKCTYLKGDLVEWQQRHRVVRSMDAAKLRGQAFLDSSLTDAGRLAQLSSKHAFYIADGKLAGLVSEVKLRVFIERLGTWPIVWLRAVDSIALPWQPDAGHEFLVPVMKMLAHQEHAARRAIDGLRDDTPRLSPEFFAH